MTVCDRLALLLEVLISHRDLCERLERGLAHDHQQALAKMLSLKKRKIQGVIKGTDVSFTFAFGLTHTNSLTKSGLNPFASSLTIENPE